MIAPIKLLEARADSEGVAPEDTLEEAEEVRNATNVERLDTLLVTAPMAALEVTEVDINRAVAMVEGMVEAAVEVLAVRPVTLVEDTDTCRVIALRARSVTIVSRFV